MPPFEIPFPSLQIGFYHRLQELRHTVLLESLLKTVGKSEIAEIDRQLDKFVTQKALRKVAGWGLRGEIVFSVPYILEQNPQLLGYYRLLLGFSQKQFYGRQCGFGIFKSLEERGAIIDRQKPLLPDFSRCLCKSAEHLVSGVERLSEELVHDLTLLTLGPQLRGGANNIFGTEATKRVFDLIGVILSDSVVNEGEWSLQVKNAAGRTVLVEFAGDPDIRIREKLSSGRFRNLVAIEIKGGTDASNIHNRLGEAEKSHQKARDAGFVECWTIVRVPKLNTALARKESPSTDRFYNIDEIARSKSHESMDFRENLCARVGIRD